MLYNNWKIAWRSFLRDRQFTVLNLVGLATGIACSLLISLWIYDELRTDRYNEKDEQLYQVMHNLKSSNGIEPIEYTPGPLAAAVVKELPDVAAAVSVVPPSWFGSEGIISNTASRFKAKPQVVGQDFFNVFTCPLVAGKATKHIAACFALPLVHWSMSAWLNNFAYRLPISLAVSLITISAILVIALATISFQSLKAALANPVRSLRND